MASRNPNYDFEGGEPAAYPPAGYLWTNAATAGVSMRNYGYWVENKEKPGADGIQIDKVRDPVLAKVTNMKYRSFDLDYPDVKRAQIFLDDLAQFESANQMPALMFMRLGNDHTSATTPGKIAPLSSFADNDYALGMMVEGVSRSKFWAARRFSCSKTTRRTGRTTWIRTARPRSSFLPTRAGESLTAPCTTPRPCCGPWS